MNPNAKEFVPAHILKRRQEETEQVEKLADRVEQVGIEESKKSDEVTPADNSTFGEKNNDAAQSKITEKDSTKTDNSTTKMTATTTSSENGTSTNVEGYSNGKQTRYQSNGIDGDDRHLLRGGEEFCEFNGEQFIIPGEDDDEDLNAQGQQGRASFDFGNAEDNEDEDVCNAYEKFLDDLPE